VPTWRRLSADKGVQGLSEDLLMLSDVLGRGRRRHERHIVERGSEDPAVRQIETNEPFQVLITDRR
jgi:hypothetical protein